MTEAATQTPPEIPVPVYPTTAVEPPPDPNAPHYYEGARFFDNASGQTMVEFHPDPYTLIGPRRATLEDRVYFWRAWNAYEAENAPVPEKPPVLDSLDPASMPCDGKDTSIDITGSGFSSTSVLVWDGTDAASVLVSDTNLRCDMTGPGFEGTSTVQVRNGEELSNELPFEFTAAETPVR